MKTYNHFVLFGAVILQLMLLSGCLEYSVITQVMKDGSLQRSIIIRGDSSSVYEGSMPVPEDASWEVTTRYEPGTGEDPGAGSVFVLEARKVFSDVESLNSELYNDSSFVDHVNIKCDLRKQFKWFCREYTYSETYFMLFPFKYHPVSDFMSEIELLVYYADKDQVYYNPEIDSLNLMTDDEYPQTMSPQDSLQYNSLLDQLEYKYEQWAKMNVFEAFYRQLTVAFAELDIRPDRDIQKEDFYFWLDSSMVFEEVFGDNDVFVKASADYYNLDSALIKSANIDGFAEFNRKLEVVAMDLDSYKNEILMPGMITESNAHEVEGSLVSWIFTTDIFYADDFTMEVSSRIVNRWMIVVTGLIVFVILSLVIGRLINKKKK